jgi:hypothetical protein
VQLERFASEELSQPHVSAPALGRSAFLLDPGGPDYVGQNSYDDTSENNTTTE